MSDNTISLSDIDPELDELLGDNESPGIVAMGFDLNAESLEDINPNTPIEDLSKEKFPPINRFEQEPDPVFTEKDYYMKVLTGEGETSHQLHAFLQKFLKEKDPLKKSIYRNQLIQTWRNFIPQLVTHYQGNHVEKRWAIRYGYLLPTLLTMEQRSMLARIVADNTYDEPIHYLDEWFDQIIDGHVNPLASDDLKTAKTTLEAKTKILFEKAQGSQKAILTLIDTFFSKRNELDAKLESEIQLLFMHDPHPTIQSIQTAYTSEQEKALKQAMEILRELAKVNNEIHTNIRRIDDANQQIDNFKDKNDQIDLAKSTSKVGENLIQSEIPSIQQMIKICVGRQGNHFPFLMKNFISSNISLIATRENVMHHMNEIEQIDTNVFRRTFKKRTMRIVPHTIILPCYGSQGICWEPFEFSNRATSRGRIAVPMFPKNLKLAVIYALGDLRWNVAKERASQYWMSEGLTGEYFQLFSGKGIRGDVKQHFLEDYILWVTKEVEGVQKLEKEVRNIFWRFIPFTQSVKDNLRNRGFVYNTLYKKDINISISGGY